MLAPRFGFDREPNFEDHWHAHVYASTESLGERLGLDAEQVQARIESGRRKLFEAREQRVRPGRDDKILVSWNALMIKGMAQAARHFDDALYLDSAERALAFIRATMWKDGRLFATCKDGRAHLSAYLDLVERLPGSHAPD